MALTEVLACGHRAARRDHRWVGTDGTKVYDTQKCLDIDEGRKPRGTTKTKNSKPQRGP
jgi:hypothetical protein